MTNIIIDAEDDNGNNVNNVVNVADKHFVDGNKKEKNKLDKLSKKLKSKQILKNIEQNLIEDKEFDNNQALLNNLKEIDQNLTNGEETLNNLINLMNDNIHNNEIINKENMYFTHNNIQNLMDNEENDQRYFGISYKDDPSISTFDPNAVNLIFMNTIQVKYYLKNIFLLITFI